MFYVGKRNLADLERQKRKTRDNSKHRREGMQGKGLTMARKSKPAGGMNPDNALRIEQTPDETGAQAMARKLMQPALKNAAAASTFTDKMIGSQIELPGLHDYVRHFQDVSEKAAEGDLSMVSRMLAAQAVTLDSMFAELARRSAMNMGDYINASERYGRLALKAQANCRATLEALAKLHQPREQTVRHVHVNDGGQAVIADQIHHHAGGNDHASTQMDSELLRLPKASKRIENGDVALEGSGAIGTFSNRT